MPINIIDLEDARLLGDLTFKEWQREWLAQWLRPLMELVIAKRDEKVLQEWDKLPQGMIETMQQVQPEKFAEATAAIDQMRKQFK